MGKKLLIYRRGGLGDTLLTFPVAQIYKKKGWEVHFVGNSDALSLALEVGFADRIFSEIPPLDPYQKIILISVEKFVRDQRVEWIYPFPPSREHITEYYLRELGLKGNPFKEELSVKPLEDWKGRIILHPGSGSEKKNPPLELYKELYQLLEEEGFSPLFVLGEAEQHLVNDLKHFDTYEVKNLKLFARLLKGAEGFVGNDSGFSHLAGYLGIPTIALFGPTDPAVWKPLGKKVVVLYKNLNCSPCFPAECWILPPKKCLLFEPREILTHLRKLTEPAFGGE